MMKAVVITPFAPSSKMASIEVKDIDGFHGAKAELGGGYIEVVPVGENFSLYVDEDGTAKGLTPNWPATLITKAMLANVGRMMLPGDYIKGVAVFVGIKEEDDGLTECDLPEEVIKEFFQEYLK